MLDFDAGNDHLQHMLEWVDQPNPPAQARDTHALHFDLFDITGDAFFSRSEYQGLMFFRPKGAGHGPVGGTAGLDGMGFLRPNLLTCRALLDDTAGNFPVNFVRVFIGFRPRASGPAAVFATLRLLPHFLPDDPTGGQIVEFSHVNVDDAGRIEMDVPNGWLLSLEATTVLIRLPGFDA